jgi:hypothetical protein
MTLARTIAAAVAAVAAFIMAVWLWKETRRPASLFTEQERTSSVFDRIADFAAAVLGGLMPDVKSRRDRNGDVSSEEGRGEE